MKTLIIVVIYNKLLEQSTTLNSIIQSNNIEFDLIIVNNGPYSLLEDFKSYNFKIDGIVNIIEYLWNKPLSNIYNDIINKYLNHDRYIILDDDTFINKNFIDELDFKSEEVYLQIPLIKNIIDNKIYYPRVNNRIINEFELKDNLFEYDEFHSIGSGLVIYKNLIDIFKMYNLDLFDQKFVFYGVDVSLFRRIMLLRDKYSIFFIIKVVSCLDHSLSEYEADFSEWKKDEMLYSEVLMIKHYSGSKSLSYLKFIKFLLKKLGTLNFRKLILAMKTYLIGYHPKSID